MTTDAEPSTSLRASGRAKSGLSRTDWAWEALRRNPEFRDDWLRSRASFRVVAEQSSLRVLAVDNEPLERWGCLFSDAPDAAAPAATVIWHPRRLTRVLALHAIATDGKPDHAPFRLADLRCNTTLLMTADGLQHLLLRDGRHSLQFLVEGASVRDPVRLCTGVVFALSDARFRLKMMQSFNDLRVTGRILRSHAPAQPATPRLDDVMRALDASQGGARTREIAEVMFGKSAVAQGWKKRNKYFRDHVRRAVRRGEALMKGGYLNFLR